MIGYTIPATIRFNWEWSSERAEQCRKARQAALTRLRQKRLLQQHQKPGKRYGSRQTIAHKRPRVGGRFVKSTRTITAEDSGGTSAHVVGRDESKVVLC